MQAVIAASIEMAGVFAVDPRAVPVRSEARVVEHVRFLALRESQLRMAGEIAGKGGGTGLLHAADEEADPWRVAVHPASMAERMRCSNGAMLATGYSACHAPGFAASRSASIAMSTRA